MTFNKLFIRTLEEVMCLTTSEVFDYLDKSAKNSSQFYNTKTLCLTPDNLAREYVLDALKTTLEAWEKVKRNNNMFNDDSDWGQ